MGLSDEGRAGGPGYTAQVILSTAQRVPPGPSAASRVQAFFEQAGFEVGEVFGNSFPLVGDTTTFAATFGPDAREVEEILRGNAGAAELSLARLPEDVRNNVTAVVVTAKPAFGPWNP